MKTRGAGKGSAARVPSPLHELRATAPPGHGRPPCDTRGRQRGPRGRGGRRKAEAGRERGGRRRRPRQCRARDSPREVGHGAGCGGGRGGMRPPRAVCLGRGRVWGGMCAEEKRKMEESRERARPFLSRTREGSSSSWAHGLLVFSAAAVLAKLVANSTRDAGPAREARARPGRAAWPPLQRRARLQFPCRPRLLCAPAARPRCRCLAGAQPAVRSPPGTFESEGRRHPRPARHARYRHA